MANLNLNISTSASLEGFVADEAGQFRTSVAVTAEQIINAGRLLILQKFQSREALTSADAVKQYLAAKLEPKQQEVFVAVFLDNQNKLIELEELFYGTVNGASVYPREVVKRALFHNAAALIVAHNHPSGTPEPSQADKAITARLKVALDLVDIRLLDHFVIGEGQVTSFAQRGLL